MQPTPESAGLEQMRSELVRINVRLGQHHPDNGGDQYDVSARQRHVGKSTELALRREQGRENEAGDDVQHRHGSDQRHFQGEPFHEGGLQKNEYRSAGDGDEAGGGGSLHIDEPSYPVQSVEIQPRLEIPPLPEKKRQDDKPAR